MKKRQLEPEEELLEALRQQMSGPPQAAARVRVSQRLEATFVGLDLGIANLASLPHSATTLKAATLQASATKATAPLTAAKAAASAAAPAAISAGAHPLATVVATFALGAFAGTGIMVASAPTAPTAAATSSAHVAPQPRATVTPRAARALTTSPTESAPEASTPEASSEEASLPSDAPRPRVENIRPSPSTQVRVAPSVAVVAPRVVASAAPTASAVPSASARPVRLSDTLAAQQSLLDQARDALARGDGESALSSLAQHERAFASTLLEEERASLKIKSLLESGQKAAAVSLAREFEAKFPRSLLLPSIRAALSKNP